MILGLAVPALGMKTHAGTLDTLPASIPQVQTDQGHQRELPGRRGRLGDRRREVRRRVARSRSTAALGRLDRQGRRRPVTSSPPGAGCRPPTDGTTSLIVLGMPYDETDPRVDDALARSCATTWCRPTLDGRRRARRRRRRRREPRLRRAAARPAGAGHRLRAAADDADHGGDVPQRAARAHLDGAQPGLGRRGVRRDDAGLPARLGERAARLHQSRASSSTGCRCSCSWSWSGCRWTTTSSCSAGSAST